MASHEETAPKAAMIARYAAADVSTLVTTNSWCPTKASRSVRGVAIIA
jgi:hypothetical protein